MVSYLVNKFKMICLNGTKCGTDKQTEEPTMVKLNDPDTKWHKDWANT